ncbi:MAG: Blue-light-activated histidine kinase [Rubritepida sp.]|nr:Blue-light-activated histidine kinase [Rubritepida sp.]
MASFEGDSPAAAVPSVMPDRRELALVAVERTRMPMVVIDPRQPDSPVIMANQAFLDLTGYTSEEVLGRNCRFLQGPGTNPADIDAIRRGLAARSDHVAVELLNYRKDGTPFWNQLSISPVMNEAGELIYYFGSQQDVTARRRIEQMEATERLLLMEVDHRSLNALSLVKSILHLSRADTIDEYSNAVTQRVDALARAHRLLAESAWAGAQLGQVIEGETPPEAAARVSATGSPFQLSAQLVQPVVMIMHELMSNAVQHGALALKDGRVSVTWVKQPGQLSLNWREEGAKSFTSPPEPGFGLRIVVGVVERQLGGKVATWWDDPGFRAEITWPVEELSVSSAAA